MDYHKHKGVESGGKLKSHPITQQHKDKVVQRYHEEAFKAENRRTQPVTRKPVPQEAKNGQELAMFPAYNGVVHVDLTRDFPYKGVRLEFTRVECRKRRHVTLAINK